jgi:peroxiredoxin
MSTHPEVLAIGAPAPTFSLPATDGKTYTLGNFDAPVFVYVQGCNHCPYVLGYLDRLKRLAEDFAPRGVQFAMVNSNDAVTYPDDDFASMKNFSAIEELPFPYLYDEDQSIAQAYMAVRTPEILVFDAERTLRYHGRIDDSAKEPQNVTATELRNALEALVSGGSVAEAETYAVGCTIKWKPGNEPIVN